MFNFGKITADDTPEEPGGIIITVEAAKYPCDQAAAVFTAAEFCAKKIALGARDCVLLRVTLETGGENKSVVLSGFCGGMVIKEYYSQDGQRYPAELPFSLNDKHVLYAVLRRYELRGETCEAGFIAYSFNEKARGMPLALGRIIIERG